MSEDDRADIPPLAAVEAPIPFPGSYAPGTDARPPARGRFRRRVVRSGGPPSRGGPPGAGAPPGDDEPPPPPSSRRKPRIKKLRLTLIVVGLGLIALISTVFGMMMAVASDLPALENRQDLARARNSILLDVRGRRLGILTSQQNRILVRSQDIPAVMKHAIIAIEDKRFYTNNGVDIQGIGRAFLQDVLRRRAAQGASTIAEQFVKNALQAQRRRTLFQKLREAALAYHLTRRWSKDKILTEYLNAIYFGNGAYGIESAARTYFGQDPNHQGCGMLGHPLCVSQLKSSEAALLAGLVASPGAYDPVVNYRVALARRNLVLRDMLDQHYLSRSEYGQSIRESGPSPAQIQPPVERPVLPSAAYFTTWVKQQVVDRYGPQVAFEGGLQIRTTLDLDLQKAADAAVTNQLSDPSGPTASLVAIDNKTGEVRAMVGGRNYDTSPFNLATEGQRQPGSAFKAFVLAQALREGISPDSVWPSQRRVFTVPGGHGEKFVVRNDESNYVGSSTLARATAFSDNSVFAAVGIQAGVGRIARTAQRMGIRTPVSHNYAITLGGLKQGVTPLDMAHGYETLAHGGERVTGTLGAPDAGPVGIREVDDVPRVGRQVNRPIYIRVLPRSLADTETSLLEGVIQYGTGTAADIGQFAAGKTGTTENYGDAWFVGWNSRLTVAVWVGYPDRVKSMRTDYNGSPVMGGTYPAQIWHDFMSQADALYQQRATPTSSTGNGPATSTTIPGPAGSSGSGRSSAPSRGGGRSTPSAPRGPTGGRPSSQGAAPAAPRPAPAPATPPSGGGGAGSGGSGGGGGGRGGGGGGRAGGTGGAGAP